MARSSVYEYLYIARGRCQNEAVSSDLRIGTPVVKGILAVVGTMKTSILQYLILGKQEISGVELSGSTTPSPPRSVRERCWCVLSDIVNAGRFNWRNAEILQHVAFL